MKVKEIKLREDDSQQPAGYTVKGTNPSTGEITVVPNVKPADIKPGSTINLDAPDQQMGEESENSTEAAMLMKLAKVVKSVQTPEQYAAAKKYARMMYDKLKMPYYGSFVPKHMRAINDLFNSIESDLRAKRRELQLAGPGRDNFEMDENDAPAADVSEVPPLPDQMPYDDEQMESIKRLAGL